MLRVAALITLIGTVSVWTPADANPLTVPAGPASPEVGSDQAVSVSLRPVTRRLTVPKARWDAKPGRKHWTLASLKALRTHAHNLPDIVPKDIANYCPSYPSATREQREAFWVGLISALSWHESTHRPTAVGGGGLWYGLTQILPGTARGYGCRARTGDALKNPEANLSCAFRIMSRTVARDRVISANMRGVAADWGPFHSRKKRSDMMAWTRKQSYCAGLPRSLRPLARTEGLMARAEQARHDREMAQYAEIRPEARPDVVVARARIDRILPQAEQPVREAMDMPVLSTQSGQERSLDLRAHTRPARPL
ncbi:transglycosylase SLT domain-containing protein [Sagittula salina]|uniref:Transglycosylase SLT domain-containing protein n=1 Tax=Sagittula salina TaxID=2820268 RepID=A0A940ML41_9RHOB|nr:transglycosylase SLT domain-containing protein [Sagittula salina]MBP0481755.1 transglycosylase SLT domain-containing protein [Sagittula salina]